MKENHVVDKKCIELNGIEVEVCASFMESIISV